MIRNFITKKSEMDLTIDVTAQPFATGEVMLAATALIPLHVAMPPHGLLRGWVEHITVLDKDDQGGLFDIVILDDNQSLGAANAAPNISDANASAIVAVVPVTSWVDVGGAQIARPSFDPVFVQLTKPVLPLSLISRDGKTYTANGIRLKIGFRGEDIDA